MTTFNMHSRLNILDVHRKINQKQEKKSVCYEKVLDICQKRILALAERDKTCCLFEFPEYVPGYPLFDLNSCMEYCKKSLVVSGFWVEYYFPNKFYITWDFEEIKEKKNEAKKQIPLSSVLPLQSSNQNNGQAQIQGQSPSTSQMQTQMQIPTPQIQHIPNVSSEFLQKMTNPLPLAPPKYNPYDIHIDTIQASNPTQVSKPINNTFFPKNPIDYKTNWKNQPNNNVNDMIGMLTSSISTHNKSVFDYKPSGKLSLNI